MQGSHPRIATLLAWATQVLGAAISFEPTSTSEIEPEQVWCKLTLAEFRRLTRFETDGWVRESASCSS